MADNIHYHSKRGMGAEWRNTGPTCAYIRLKAKRADSKSCSSLSVVRGLSWLHPPSIADRTTLTSFPPSWAGAVPFSLHLRLPLAGYPTAQASPASWGLQCNPVSTLWASYNGIPGPPWRDSPLPRAWPRWLSFTVEEGAMTPVRVYPSWL